MEYELHSLSNWNKLVEPSEWLMEGFEQVAMALPFRSPAVDVGHPEIGPIGTCVPGRGFRVKGMSTSNLRALLEDHNRILRKRRSILQKVLGNEKGAITTWDGVVASKSAGLADDVLGYKTSQTTVANVWSGFFDSGGFPGAGTFTAINSGAVMSAGVAGSWPMARNTVSGSNDKYLVNFGANHLTGTNIICFIDMLWAGGNVLMNTVAAQAVSGVALTRYTGTDAAGNMMIMHCTSACGATATNVTVTYTNQAGTAGQSTGAVASMPASLITFRLGPTAGGLMIPLAAGDLGVRRVQQVQNSASMATGICAIYIYRPLLLIPTIATTTFVERSTPGMLAGMVKLGKDGSGYVGCYTFLVLPSTTSTGIQTYFTQMVEG